MSFITTCVAETFPESYTLPLQSVPDPLSHRHLLMRTVPFPSAVNPWPA